MARGKPDKSYIEHNLLQLLRETVAMREGNRVPFEVYLNNGRVRKPSQLGVFLRPRVTIAELRRMMMEQIHRGQLAEYLVVTETWQDIDYDAVWRIWTSKDLTALPDVEPRWLLALHACAKGDALVAAPLDKWGKPGKWIDGRPLPHPGIEQLLDIYKVVAAQKKLESN